MATIYGDVAGSQALKIIRVKGDFSQSDGSSFRIVAPSNISFDPDNIIVTGAQHALFSTSGANDTLVIGPITSNSIEIDLAIFKNEGFQNSNNRLNFTVLDGDIFGANKVADFAPFELQVAQYSDDSIGSGIQDDGTNGDDERELALYSDRSKTIEIPALALKNLVFDVEFELVTGTELAIGSVFELGAYRKIANDSPATASFSKQRMVIPDLVSADGLFQIELSLFAVSPAIQFIVTGVSRTTIISNNAILIDDESVLELLDPNSIEGEELVFSGINDGLEEIVSGNVLVIGVTDKTPNGLLKKVINSSVQDGFIVIETEQGTLADVIVNGSIELSGEILPVVNAANANALVNADFDSDTGVKKLYALKGVEIHDARSNDAVSFNDCAENNDFLITLNSTFNDATNIQGCLGFAIDYDLDIDFSFGDVSALLFTTKVETSFEINISNSTLKEYFAEEKVIATYQLPNINYSIADIPLVIVPQIEIILGVNGELSAVIITGAASDASTSVGIALENDTWQPLSDTVVDFDIVLPRLSASATVTTYVGPSVEMLFYGISGPRAGVQGYVSLEADTDEVPWWVFRGGMRVDTGVNVDVLDNKLTQYSLPDVIDYEGIAVEANGSFADDFISAGLEVSNFSLKTGLVLVGDSFLATAFIQNKTDFGLPDAKVNYYFSSVNKSEQRAPDEVSATSSTLNFPLQAGSATSRTVLVTAPATSGVYYVWACVEPGSNLIENKTPCSFSKAITVVDFDEGSNVNLGTATVLSGNDVIMNIFDNGLEDGDLVEVTLNGAIVLSSHTLKLPPGTNVPLSLEPGTNYLVVKALNEGLDSPNTASFNLSNVSNGTGEFKYSLNSGGIAGLKIIVP